MSLVASAGGDEEHETKKKKVLVPIADGSEEIEAVTVIDVLRRAGAEVTVCAIEDDGRTEVTCSRGVKIVADCNVKDVAGRGAPSDWDLIAVPGGEDEQRQQCPSLRERATAGAENGTRDGEYRYFFTSFSFFFPLFFVIPKIQPPQPLGPKIKEKN